MSDWQTAKWAPKNGHPFLAHVPTESDADFNPTGVVEVYYLEDEGFIAALWNPEQDCWDATPVRFTHWMPLPKSPSSMTTTPQPRIKAAGEKTRDEHDLRVMRGMEATNAFVCWECRTVKIKASDWWATKGCRVCGNYGFVLPFLLRPKEDAA